MHFDPTVYTLLKLRLFLLCLVRLQNLALLSVTPVPVDGTSNAYEGVMKMVDFVVEVPEGYKNTLKAIITNTAVTDITVCFGALVTVSVHVY